MFFRDLTLYHESFKGFEGDVWELRKELDKRYIGTTGVCEVANDVTLYDFPVWGATNELIEWCKQFGVDIYEQWKSQKEFDKICAEAVAKVW